jgi:hypothetical protein
MIGTANQEKSLTKHAAVNNDRHARDLLVFDTHRFIELLH